MNAAAGPGPNVELYWGSGVDRIRDGTIQSLRECLTSDERARIERLRIEPDRRRATVSRGVLRLLLGRRLGVLAPDVPLGATANGRPLLAARYRGIADFNVAHSGELVAWVLTRRSRVGLDVERWPGAAFHEHARLVLSPRERRAARDADTQTLGLLAWRAWVRKEALLKAIGTGLRIPPGAIDLRIERTAPTQTLTAAAGYGRWKIVEFHPIAGYLGALALFPAAIINCERIEVDDLLDLLDERSDSAARSVGGSHC